MSSLEETAVRYGWIIPATFAVVSLGKVGLAAWSYRKDPVLANKSALDGARKLCLLWLAVTAFLGAIAIWLVPYLIAK